MLTCCGCRPCRQRHHSSHAVARCRCSRVRSRSQRRGKALHHALERNQGNCRNLVVILSVQLKQCIVFSSVLCYYVVIFADIKFLFIQKVTIKIVIIFQLEKAKLNHMYPYLIPKSYRDIELAPVPHLTGVKPYRVRAQVSTLSNKLVFIVVFDDIFT